MATETAKVTHTPGPWHGGDHRQADATFAICQRGYRVASVHPRNINVPPMEPDPEQAANARLIAASPELLDALKKCADVIEEEVAYANGEDHPTIQRHAKVAAAARAVIAKAEGR